MPYRIYQFGAVPLPDVLPEDDLSTGAAESTLLASLGGAFDSYGSRRALPRMRTIQFRGMYYSPETIYLVDHAGKYIVDHAGNEIIVGTAATILRNRVDNLRAMEGKRASLYRKREDDSAIQWLTARLLAVQQMRTLEDAGKVARLELQFETQMAAWRAAAASTVTKTLVSGGAVGLNVTADGNAPVSDAILTITASGGTITSLAIKAFHAGIDLRWVGTLTSGQALVIDAGAQTVLQDGGSAYSGFSLGSGHTAQGWLPMAEGITPLVIESNGPGTAAAAWYNQWI